MREGIIFRMFDLLYCFFVKPIELVVEIIFIVMYKAFSNAGIAIVFVSILIQLLVLPMYRKSDALQEEERNKQLKMKPWVDHIKKTFKGDERFMMLQAYYREVGYKPAHAIKGSLSLLLQIPFFIAAYNYLSNLYVLEGASFLGIRDLSAPDGILSLAGFTLNLLPILMTIFNIISGIIYTRGFPIKDKIQTYGLALIFLVVLYNCPAGLVLYWTLNNLFSLGKNIVMRIFLRSGGKVEAASSVQGSSDRVLSHVFTFSMVVLTLLMGGIIPLAVVSSSPSEFVSVSYGPIGLVLRSLAVYSGVFLLWCRVFYILSSEKGKKIMTYIAAVLSVAATVNYYCFGRHLGTMSTFLVYDDEPSFEAGYKLLSIILLLVISFAVVIILKKKGIVLKRLLQAGVSAFCVLILVGGFETMTHLPENMTPEYVDYRQILPLSKNGKNVIILMLDRAMASYVPYIINEKPQLKEVFDGFRYYPNTLSYATITNMAAGPLFGGYEYVPTKVNERKDESLESKHNEALTVLPKLFLDNDYEVVVTDPPYAGYCPVPDISIYDKYKTQGKGLTAYRLDGKYAAEERRLYSSYYESKQKRSFLFYSAMRACPLAMQMMIYDHGNYRDLEPEMTLEQGFINNFTVLDSLPAITKVKDDDSNNFLMMQNETTHAPVYLQYPGYEPVVRIKGPVAGDISRFTLNGIECRMSEPLQIMHYDVNMAALLAVGRWLDYMKEQGVYDNTRIIIAADHGRDLKSFDSMIINDGVHPEEDIESFNPLFMVKDFNAKGFDVSDEFMTNADAPAIAVEGLVDDPINPFTGNKITNEDKYKGPQLINTSHHWEVDKNNGNVFDTSDGFWYSVKSDMRDPKNWECIGP